jgi:metal-responsive CopG/Arc/MetJ family transcriptional regulator
MSRPREFTTMIQLRVPSSLLKRLDDYIDQEPDIGTTRSMTIRRALSSYLTSRLSPIENDTLA